jgi:pyridoxal phosphate enzyme (YggS family)
MTYSGLAARVSEVRARIAERQVARGWTHDVAIVAVTKGHPVEAVQAAMAAGLTAVGENRVQEALAKQEALGNAPAEWHLIGSLQKNKARHAVNRFALIHSIDRHELAAELDRRASAPQDVLVQVNCSAEAQKGGVEPEGLLDLLGQVAALPQVRVRGLMTMAEFTDDTAVQRRTFAQLRTLRDDAVSRGHAVTELSMGMSGDYLVAVEEGATMVRLGTILFGERGR